MSFLRNLFIPHKGNNYKARLLHHPTLIAVICFLVISTYFLNAFSSNFPQVLGISTDITTEQLLTLLNQKRQENSLHGLSLNPELSAAALNKANDMIANNYWAHNSPEGKTPWAFIKEAGYTYVYAGENLARGFTTSSDVTNAWMDSPSHKANMLSSNYTEVGFAVITGTLNGEETVLVVQELGNRNLAVLPKTQTIQEETVQVQEPGDESLKSYQVASQSEQELQIPTPQSLFASSQVVRKPMIDSSKLTSNLSVLLVVLVVFTLISEMAILERRKIFNFARHNPDHIFFLISILLIMFILGRGMVL